jgi:transposase
MRGALPALLACATRDDPIVQAGCDVQTVLGPTTAGAEKKRGRPPPPPPVTRRLRLRDCTGPGGALRSDVRVPCDTNPGERAIRLVPGQQQVSGGGRTLEGAQRFGRMRGDLSTARQQANNVLEAIRDACAGTPFLPSPEMQ